MLGIALRCLRLLEIGMARGKAAVGGAIANALRYGVGLFEIAPVGSQDFVGNRVLALHEKSHQRSAVSGSSAELFSNLPTGQAGSAVCRTGREKAAELENNSALPLKTG
jgi:hypothetical protein